MSHKIRDTAAAVLFLACLLAGILYLSTGFYFGKVYLKGAGFRAADKPTFVTARLSSEKKPSPPRYLPDETPSSAPDLEKLTATLMAVDDTVEQTLTDLLDRDHAFIEAYGLAQHVLGRRVMEDVEEQYTVTRLSDGSLSFLNPESTYTDTSDHARKLAEFQAVLEEELGISLLFVQVPQKASLYNSATLADGLYDYGDSHVNTFLHTLEEEGVDHLDLRPVLAETGRYGELFFRTDHHWTAEGAFIGWQAVAEKLKTDYNIFFNRASTDPDCWERTIYENLFLGSQGKRVGSVYAGMDDFETWVPKGETSFRYTVPIQAYRREGSMEETVLFPERLLESDPYQANPYTYYSGGDFSFARIKNLDNPDGSTFVLLRDSFACPFTPFMAMGCGELVTIDMRYFKDDLMTYLEWVEADMVIVLYSPGSLTNPDAFDFFFDPATASQPANRRPATDVLNLEKPVLRREEAAHA